MNREKWDLYKLDMGNLSEYFMRGYLMQLPMRHERLEYLKQSLTYLRHCPIRNLIQFAQIRTIIVQSVLVHSQCILYSSVSVVSQSLTVIPYGVKVAVRSTGPRPTCNFNWKRNCRRDFFPQPWLQSQQHKKRICAQVKFCVYLRQSVGERKTFTDWACNTS